MRRYRALIISVTAALLMTMAAGVSAPVQAAAPNPHEVSSDALANAHARPETTSVPADAGSHGKGSRGAHPGLPNIDSLVNFTGSYKVQGQDPLGNPTNTWFYDTVGHDPRLGGTTHITAPIVPVSLNLLDANNNVAFTDSVKPFVGPTLNSPVFQDATYSSSSTPTQFSDAVQRAEYHALETSDWHTLLAPHVTRTRTMSLPDGAYFFALNKDGTCCRFVLVNINAFANLLFPATPTDTTTPVGAAEHAGDITTKDISTFLFPNTYLYFGSDPLAPGACCVLGFHTYDSEPGSASNGNLEKRYVVNYSSWISPGLFSGGFQDVTALSHEIAETYNDPFVASDNVHNITPWWTAGGNCADDLETGDVIEGLNNAVFPIRMHGFTYHPQNEALLQWFESKHYSDALHGAFSYPNESVLTSSNVSQTINCGGPIG